MLVLIYKNNLDHLLIIKKKHICLLLFDVAHRNLVFMPQRIDGVLFS